MIRKKKLYGDSRTIPLMKTELQVFSWLKRGKIRWFVFTNIKENTLPSEIVEKLSQGKRKSLSYYAQVSRALAELESAGLIKCLNPKEKTGRLYSLNTKGQQILEKHT
jgi:DNA-binding transcriptional ArsR family regulator